MPETLTQGRARRRAAVVLLLCALGAGGAVAAAHGGQSSAPRVLRLTATIDPHSIQTTDVGAHGPSAGDVTVYSATVRSGKTVVGRLEGATTAADPDYQGDVKTEYLALHDGTIAIVGGGQSGAPGVGRPDSKILDAVVGGTGRYVGAGGSVSVRDVSDMVMQMTLRLTK